MIRKWLRALIGWEDVGAALLAQRDHLVAMENLLKIQDQEIAALKYPHIRKPQRNQIIDWEQQVADYAANPDNFKEN
jgi:hypothetical protein